MATQNVHRAVEPYELDVQTIFTNEEILAAFSIASPDEDLYFDLFGPGASKLTAADFLRQVAKLLDLVSQATAMGFVTGAPAPK